MGPIWRGGQAQEAALLGSCYESAMRLAAMHAVRSIAFPAVITGAYGYPLHESSKIAVQTTRSVAEELKVIERVVFCTFNPKATETYRDLLHPK